jgi:hypothetical protein
MQWVWVDGHWDVHLTGLCRHDGKLCRFEVEWDKVGDHSEITTYTIYALSPLEKLRWLWRKKKFEICVGRHWTYPDLEDGVRFRKRKPRWLGALLWAWHYGNIRDALRRYYDAR